MEERNLYDVLGSTSQSTVRKVFSKAHNLPFVKFQAEQLLAEYRVRVLSAHPDKQQGRNEEFQLLQQAREILTDPAKRKHYDTYLSLGSHMPLNEWMSSRERLQQVLFPLIKKQSL
jgi:hypothetical protein